MSVPWLRYPDQEKTIQDYIEQQPKRCHVINELKQEIDQRDTIRVNIMQMALDLVDIGIFKEFPDFSNLDEAVERVRRA